MLTPDFFSLNVYFKNTNKYYYFFDGLIKQSGKMQRDILLEAKIPASSYRISRTVEESRTDSHNILLNYFHIEEMKEEKQIEYETIISKLYFAIYYKAETQIEQYYTKALECIEENNYLKPIFVLLKIFTKMNYIKDYTEFLNENKEDIKYLSAFPKEYFNQELEMLFSLLMMFTNHPMDRTKIELSIDQFPKLSWIYYHISGTFAYCNQDYAEAILFYKKAEEEYLKDCNILRYIWVRNNIAAMYNRLGNAKSSLDIIQPVFLFLSHSDMNLPMRNYILMHYFMSLFLLEAYEVILQVKKDYVEESMLLPTTAILLICTYKKMKHSKDSCASLRFVDERANLFYEILFENKKMNSKEKLLLQSTNYLKKIFKIMKL